MKRIIAVVAAATWILLATGSVHATDGKWTRANSTGRWTQASNWESDVIADGDGATAIIAGPIDADNLRINLNGSRTIGHLVFDYGDTAGQWILNLGSDVLTLSDLASTPTIETISEGKIAGAIGGTQGFIKSGDGTLTLDGDSTYSGITDITQGVVQINSNNAMGATAGNRTFVRNGASLDVTGGVDTAEPLTLSGNGPEGSNYGAVRLGDGSTLKGNIRLDGDARIRQQNGTGTISGDIRLPGSDVLNLWVNDGRTLNITGNITGNGGLLINRPGTVQLTGDSDFGGGTVVRDGLLIAGNNNSLGSGEVRLNGGTLRIDDGVTLNNSLVFGSQGGTLSGRGTYGSNLSVGENGTISPGSSPGMLTIDGDYTQQALALLEIELGGLIRGDEYDALIVTGTMSLAGSLDVTLWNGFEPLAGNSFDILDWGNLNGRFDFVNLPTLGNGLYWDTSALYTGGVLSVSNTSPVPLPGALLLGSLGMGLVGWLRKNRTL